MHGLSRLGRSSSSPPSSPRYRHGRNKSTGGGFSGGGLSSGRCLKQNLVERLVFVVISVVFKRKGVLLLAPLLYISGMLLYMGSLGFDGVDFKSVVVVPKRHPPGSLYRSPQLFEKLWPFMEAEDNSNATDNAVFVLSCLVVDLVAGFCLNVLFYLETYGHEIVLFMLFCLGLDFSPRIFCNEHC